MTMANILKCDEKKRRKKNKMNKNEIYSKIERCVDELKQKESECIKQEILLRLGDEEYLICDICFRSLHNETTHISISSEQKKVLCENCWQKENKVKEDE